MIVVGDIVARRQEAATSLGIFSEPRPHQVLRVIEGRTPIAEVLCVAPIEPSALAHWPYWALVSDLFHVNGPGVDSAA